ncbi:MAG TPA: hypothetical protein VNK04_06375 [Gemmataceae bacterium]|nr:hypothetical protein [Gemmataceae bacterium]
MSGKVTYQGKAVPFGTVLIQGRDGIARQGNIATDGSYTVRGVVVGEARVAVNSPNPRSIQLVSQGGEKQEPYPDVPGWFPIPKQYEKVETSGLTYTIKRGQNTIDIELK